MTFDLPVGGGYAPAGGTMPGTVPGYEPAGGGTCEPTG